MDDGYVVFRRSRKAIVGRNAWQIARDMHLREMTVRRKNKHALWFIAKRQGLAAIGGRDFGDHEVPGSDKLLLQGLGRLCHRGRTANRNDHTNRKQPQSLHGIPPMSFGASLLRNSYCCFSTARTLAMFAAHACRERVQICDIGTS